MSFFKRDFCKFGRLLVKFCVFIFDNSVLTLKFCIYIEIVAKTTEISKNSANHVF